MSVRFPVFAITHIHTEGSNGESSEMDEMNSACLREVLGQDTPARWAECFTTVDRLVKLLNSKRHRPRVGIITVTDHMNVRSHTLPDTLLKAAATEPRLAACAEITTVEKDIDGVFRRAPEVLVYGGPHKVPGPFGEHYGLSQEIVDDIFANCRVPGLQEVRTSLIIGHCAALGLACALAHPFDGHFLSLEATLNLISQGQYIETVNGGFPAISTRILEDLVSFQNRVVSGWRMSAETAQFYPLAKRLEDKIIAQGRSMLHPWGGSDAHSHNFARVVMRFLSFRPDSTPGDMFEAMLRKDVMDHLIDGTFSVQGRPGSVMSVVDDITRIVWRNLWHNRPYMLDTPGHAYGMVMKTQKVVRQELARRAKHQEGLVYQATKNFDSNRILADLVPPHRLDIREARRRERSILPAPTVLPSYLLDAHHTNHRSYGIN
ncbi:MAG: hypothetical protein JRJ19_11015 [Deltaproteobacteria bacterium]|nr:hypothetical protein [Deltaproteobacteria bacterium]MBW1872589.1 hypothetical protein [Deltaproteobacteria bacterium]